MFTRDCIFEWFKNVDEKRFACEEIQTTEVIKLIIINKDLSMRFYLREKFDRGLYNVQNK